MSKRKRDGWGPTMRQQEMPQVPHVGCPKRQGPYRVPASRILLVIGPGGANYRFECPGCEQDVVNAAGVSDVQFLEILGVLPVIVETGPGEAIDDDDVIGFGLKCEARSRLVAYLDAEETRRVSS